MVAGIIGLALLMLMVGIIAALRRPRQNVRLIIAIDSTPPRRGEEHRWDGGKKPTGHSGPAVNACRCHRGARDPVSNDWVVEVKRACGIQSLKDIHDDKAATKSWRPSAACNVSPARLPIMAPPPDVEKPAAPGPSIVPSGESIPFVSPGQRRPNSNP